MNSVKDSVYKDNAVWQYPSRVKRGQHLMSFLSKLSKTCAEKTEKKATHKHWCQRAQWDLKEINVDFFRDCGKCQTPNYFSQGSSCAVINSVSWQNL